MTKKQFILEVAGLLDRTAAERFLDRLDTLAGEGVVSLQLDCSNLERTIFEDWRFFLSEIEVRLSRGVFPEDLFITSLPPRALMQAQLLGYEVVAGELTVRMIDLPRDTPQAGAPQANILVCKHCSSKFRVQTTGNFACPHCGVHFYANRQEQMVYYEPFQTT